MVPLRILVGLVLLCFGRQAFWLFVAYVGLVSGMALAMHLLPDGNQVAALCFGLGLAVVGAVLVYFFYHVAIGAVGFVAGGRLGIELATALLPSSTGALWVAFILGAVIGAALFLVIFDWALIVISSLLGAEYLVEPGASGVLFVVLVVAGIAVQAAMMRRRARAG